MKMRRKGKELLGLISRSRGGLKSRKRRKENFAFL
jgi:hypothetical protein